MKQKAITISLIKNNSIENNADEQRMTSMEIAQLTGKQHKNVMQAIRNMEPAWEKTAGLKFQLGSYEDANGQMRPCYSLTKTECLYIATKFNDEARARLGVLVHCHQVQRRGTRKTSVEMAGVGDGPARGSGMGTLEVSLESDRASEGSHCPAGVQRGGHSGRGRRHYRRRAGRVEPAKRRLLYAHRDWQAFRTGRARP